jgi:uncharacterized protein (TIGR00369 family)
MIWTTLPDIARMTELGLKGATSHMGIEFTEVGDDFLRATMPVDERTKQPFGLLHGGASVLLAETVGSMAANFCVAEGEVAVGLDINANHVRAVTEGLVTATATPVNIGRTIQVWQINIEDQRGKLVCASRLTMAVKKHA